eukprot:5797938-Heterocapsa_arctica.AAC.1
MEPELSEHQTAIRGGSCGPNIRKAFLHLTTAYALALATYGTSFSGNSLSRHYLHASPPKK